MTSWRYLTDDRVDAAAGLATDEALLTSYGRGQTPTAETTLRLYSYRPHCALVGRYQNLEDEVDLGFCARHDVQVGRRPTGGGAILMGPAQLGIALVARARPEETPREALTRYAGGVVAGLAALGLDARFRSKNDLEVDGRKIAGLGLYLDPHGAVLFHASVLIDLDIELMLSALRIPGAKVSDKAVARVEERVTTVSRLLGRPLAAADVRPEVARGLAESFGVELEPGEPSVAERRRAEELVASRYGRQDWIGAQSPQRDARGWALVKTPAGLLRIYVGVHGKTIKSVLVTGDFNLLPAGVARLEAALKWCRAERGRIAEITDKILAEEGSELPPEPIAGAIAEAAERAIGLARVSHPARASGSCYFPDPAETTSAVRSALEPRPVPPEAR